MFDNMQLYCVVWMNLLP